MGNTICPCLFKDAQSPPQIIHDHMTGKVSIVSRPSVAKDSPKKIVTCLYNYKEAYSGKGARIGDNLEVYHEIDDDEWLKVLNLSTKEILSIPKSYVTENSVNEIQEWFFENLTRRQAEKILMNQQIRGVFLIRYSQKEQNCYTLSILDYDGKQDFHVIHFKIVVDLDQNGLTVDSETYSNLNEIVQAFKESKKITTPCPKPQPYLWDLDVSHKKQWELSREDIHLGKIIDEGNFGKVYQAVWKNSKKVAVKVLKEDSVSKDDILREATIMKRFRHPGLLPLYGVCSDTHPIFLVLEYMTNKDLLKYLRKDHGETILFADLIDIAVQISSAMEYIESKNLVHRDLAARNVLVGNNNIVKISDFGLARALHNNVYRDLSNTNNIAFKWTAPEAIFDKEFTTKSDVWSYGILLTELFTYGRIPYPGLRNHHVIELLKTGYRMEKPSDLVTDSIYKIMLQCWKEDPEKRISFKQLTEFFKGFLVYSE